MKGRSSGILLPIFSLPGAYGIGSLGGEARRFIDFLADAHQHVWQILPLVPTGSGDSPYMSPSAFAGNPWFLDLEDLAALGLLTREELSAARCPDPDHVDYAWLHATRLPLLRRAWTRDSDRASRTAFLESQSDWLPDHALFCALHDHLGQPLDQWPDVIRRREPDALNRCRRDLADEIDFQIFLQYHFFRQWRSLKAYANDRDISILGDLPIYVSADSAQVWARPELFQLDEDFLPSAVAGVPPDAFSEVGQHWGNPLYDWAGHREALFLWWGERMKNAALLYDMVRIDHFRGFHTYWSIPAGAEHALEGHWEPGPGQALLNYLSAEVPKLELIAELPEDAVITTYTIGKFTDLCRGPHLPSTGKLGAFKLTKLAGAYWRGDAEREMLTRIYGTAFFKQKELDEHLRNLEEAEKRDHRKLGRELGIYTMDPLAGVGLPMYLPKGARVIRTMQEWLRRDLYERGYEEVITPHVYNADVWKTSGHYGFYKENMYFFNINEGTDEDPRLTEYAVKPMNCPGHVMLYKSELHSYRDLPLRYFEFGTVYRHEMSGVVHGLLRARGFTQDDAHVFCTRDQVVDEVVAILDLVDHIMSTFGFQYEAEISTRPEKSIGTDDMWEHATNALKEACARHELAYDINEGDGAFYGPKIDIKVKDAIGRTWQCSTVQVDFNMPERFELTYRTEDNTEERPWMLHRAIFGSIERFLGILIEHYAGALPLWLAPVQVAVLPLADRHNEAAHELAKQLKAAGGRIEVYDQNEPMRVKIAKAQSQKIPYMVVLGDKEIENGTVSVRERHEGDLGAWPVEQLVEKLREAAL